MPAYAEKDFDKMAEDIVRGFMDKGEKLADGAARSAKEAGLNPDQIERLAQTTNNLAFLRLMDRSKSAGVKDLTGEFEPVEASTIIRIIIRRAAPAADHAPASSGTESDTLPDEMASVRAPEKAEKAASTPLEMPRDEIGDRRRAQQAAFHQGGRLRKLAEHLHIERLAVEQDFDAKVSELGKRMRRINAPSLEAFEKDAMSVRSDALAIGVLDTLRGVLRTPAREPLVPEKIAQLFDHHLATPSEELRLFEELISDAERSQRLEEGSAWIRTRLH